MRLNYNEISPITGNLTVLTEIDDFSSDTVKLCMESGYQTYLNSWRIENSEIISKIEEQFPFDVVNTKFIDASTGNIWYKTFLLSPSVLLFPDEKLWRVAALLETDPGSGIEIQVPVSPNTNVTKYLDLESSSEFSEFHFEDALFEFQKRISENNRDEN